MQRIRLYFLDRTIIDGYIEKTSAGDIRLIELLNSQTHRRRVGMAECITITNGAQMIFNVKPPKTETPSEGLEFLDEKAEQGEQQVPLDFVLDESLVLHKTLTIEERPYVVNIGHLVFAHSLSEFKGVQTERKRALKTAVPFDVNIITLNNYLCSGKVMVPSLNRELPKDIAVGRAFMVLSDVKVRHLPSSRNLYRLHDHLIVNTHLIKAFY